MGRDSMLFVRWETVWANIVCCVLLYRTVEVIEASVLACW